MFSDNAAKATANAGHAFHGVVGHSARVCDIMLQPLYRDLVTAINNADTVITLVVPSTVIIVCNVRISVALSQFYRSIEVSSSRRLLTTNSSLCTANQPRHCRRHAADRRPSWAAASSVTIYSNSSYNRLQMKVSLPIHLMLSSDQTAFSWLDGCL